jgi:hypothetical protein
LHEENVGNVKFPGLVLGAEFGRLFEDFLNGCVVLFIPVELGLHHENRDVLVKARIVFLKSHVDGLRVTGDTGILDSLGFLTESVDVVRG